MTDTLPALFWGMRPGAKPVLSKRTMGDFDPYHLWLQIPPGEQPPSLYRLLGLTHFESDPNVIDNAAEQRLMHLRNVQNGPQGQIAQKIMNEVSRARLTLLKEDSRVAYDQQLKKELAAKASAASTGQAVLPPTSSSARTRSVAPPAATKNTQPRNTQPVITQKATAKSLAYARAKKNKSMVMGLMIVVLLGLVGGIIYFVVSGKKVADSNDDGAAPHSASPSGKDTPDKDQTKNEQNKQPHTKQKSEAAQKNEKGKPSSTGEKRTQDPNDLAVKQPQKIDAGDRSKSKGEKTDPNAREVLDALYASTFSNDSEKLLATTESIELLPLLKFPESVKQGVVRRQKSSILFESTKSINHVEFPVMMPAAYDLEATVTRLSPEDGFCIGMHVANKPCCLMIDGYPLSGFKTGIRKLLADINSPLREDVVVGQILKYNEPTKLKVQVRPSGVQLLVDGEVKYKYVGSPAKIQTVPMVLQGTTNFFNFWLMSWKTRFQIEDVKLTPRGRAAEQPDWLATATVESNEKLGPPVDLLNKVDLSFVLREPVAKNRFGLSVGPGRLAGLEIPHELPREYNLKMNVVSSGEDGLAAVIPVGDRKAALMIDSVRRNQGKKTIRTAVQTVHRRYMEQGIHPGYLPVKLLPIQKEIQLEIKVRDDAVRLLVDGKFVYGWAGTRYELDAPVWKDYPRTRQRVLRLAALSNQFVVKKLSYRSVTRSRGNLARQTSRLQQMNPSLKEFWELHDKAEKIAVQEMLNPAGKIAGDTDPPDAKTVKPALEMDVKGNEIDPKRIQLQDLSSTARANLQGLKRQVESIGGLLKKHEFEEATRMIEDVFETVESPESTKVFAGISQVSRDVKAFWEAVPERCALLKATQQIEFAETYAIVVAANKSELTVRMGGESKTYATDELPVGLAMKIVDMTSTRKSGSYYRMKGNVFYLESLSHTAHREQAIHYWLQAEKMGEDIESLLSLVAE